MPTCYPHASPCRYVVCGVSLAVSAVVTLLECCTCNLCGLGKVLDVIVAGFGAVWWVLLGVAQRHACGFDGCSLRQRLPSLQDKPAWP